LCAKREKLDFRAAKIDPDPHGSTAEPCGGKMDASEIDLLLITEFKQQILIRE
jgi:hypothetical protein